jgi:RND superfamily putative drug exporter
VSFHQRPQAPECNTAELAEALDGGAVLIDVRMPGEYAEVHVPGAVLIPLPELGARTDEVPADSQVYIICGGGSRSLHAAAALNNAGWDTVSVAGGTRAWVAEGRPVHTGTDT